ncbi:MAG: NAD(P)-dependent oxidoreductase, partial [Planctomycetota bacterium]
PCRIINTIALTQKRDQMKFNRIVAIDNTGLVEEAINKLNQYSETEVVVWNENPQTDDEIVMRTADAECILVSWNTDITANVIERCPRLRLIGLCCSLYDNDSSNVDVEFARSQGIDVIGVHDYGDEGLVKFVLCETIRLCKGIGLHQWRSEPVELTKKILGIIGLGTTGRMLANRAQAFGMKVIYFSRSRKPDAEQNGIEYRKLNQLLRDAEIVSMHLPRNSNILGSAEFSQLGTGKILINTSMGLVFDKLSFVEWVKSPGNFAIFDGDGISSNYDEFTKLKRVIATRKVSGWTQEARQRLSGKVVENVAQFLNGNTSPL